MPNITMNNRQKPQTTPSTMYTESERLGTGVEDGDSGDPESRTHTHALHHLISKSINNNKAGICTSEY